MVVIVLLFLTGPLQYLPRFVVRAPLCSIAIGLIDCVAPPKFWQKPREILLAICDHAVTVAVVGLEQGILLAIGVSLLRHVRHSYHPHTSVFAPGPAGRWLPVPAVPGVQTEPGLLVYHFGADLFYANENRFTDEVRDLVAHAPAPVRKFIVDAGAITAIDYSRPFDCVTGGTSIVWRRAPARRLSSADMDRHRITAAVRLTQSSGRCMEAASGQFRESSA